MYAWNKYWYYLPISEESPSQCMKHLFCLVSHAESIPGLSNSSKGQSTCSLACSRVSVVGDQGKKRRTREAIREDMTVDIPELVAAYIILSPAYHTAVKSWYSSLCKTNKMMVFLFYIVIDRNSRQTNNNCVNKLELSIAF